MDINGQILFGNGVELYHYDFGTRDCLPDEVTHATIAVAYANLEDGAYAFEYQGGCPRLPQFPASDGSGGGCMSMAWIGTEHYLRAEIRGNNVPFDVHAYLYESGEVAIELIDVDTRRSGQLSMNVGLQDESGTMGLSAFCDEHSPKENTVVIMSDCAGAATSDTPSLPDATMKARESVYIGGKPVQFELETSHAVELGSHEIVINVSVASISVAPLSDEGRRKRSWSAFREERAVAAASDTHWLIEFVPLCDGKVTCSYAPDAGGGIVIAQGETNHASCISRVLSGVDVV